jgi:uncharacterized protein YdhG (YjbR/CyaY superfamily)
MNNEADAYIEKQESPQKEILQELRRMFRETLPNCKEEMRWGVVTFEDGKFYVAAMKNRVHLGFAITGLSNEEMSLFEGNGKTMRQIKIPTVESIHKKNLPNLIRLVDQKAACKPC